MDIFLFAKTYQWRPLAVQQKRNITLKQQMHHSFNSDLFLAEDITQENSVADPDPALNFPSSRSSFEFSDFRIHIQTKVPDPCGSGSNLHLLSIFRHNKKTP